MTTAYDGRTGLRHDADFRRYWLARVASLTGSLVTAVAMPVLIYRLTGSAFLTALVTTLEAVPYAVFGLFAGAVGDRWDRRRVMVLSDAANVLVIGSVPLAWSFDALTAAHALVAAFLAQTLFTFFDGANFGALPVLVGRDRVAEGNAAIWAAGGVLDLAVPAAVGLALTVLHPAELLVVDALSFAVSVVLVRAIARPLSAAREAGSTATTLLGDVGVGVRYLLGHAGVRSMTVTGALQSIAGAGFMGLAVVWCDRVLDIGTSGWRFGLLFSVWGIGGIAASWLVPRALRRTSATRLTLVAIPLSGASGVCVAVSTDWALAVLGMVVWGIAYQTVLLGTLTYRQQVAPEHLLSRVNTAARMVSWGIGWPVGALAGGVLAARLGVREALIVVVCVGVLAAVFAWTSPLRREV
ncbi:MAG TPA: MFS transporter [Marmoricola sp.]|jgi:MFS family permease|nr:MFS transporter [Marmoricola sp.]